MNKHIMIKIIVHWLLLVVLLVYLLTGFGITEFKTVEAFTFGLLTKPLSFKIHNNILIPLLVLLILHISLSYVFKERNGKGSI